MKQVLLKATNPGHELSGDRLVRQSLQATDSNPSPNTSPGDR